MLRLFLPVECRLAHNVGWSVCVPSASGAWQVFLPFVRQYTQWFRFVIVAVKSLAVIIFIGNTKVKSKHSIKYTSILWCGCVCTVHVARFHFRNENRLTARWRELFVVLVHFFLFPGQCFIEPCIERFYPFHVPTDALFSGCTASLLRSVTDHYIWFSWAQPKVCLSSLRLLTVCLNKLFITFKQSIGFHLCNDIPLFHQNHFKFLPMSSVITATVIWASCFSQLFTKRQCFKMLSKLFTKTLGIDRVVLYTANEIRA